MVYVAKTEKAFRIEGGSLSRKISSEFSLVDAAIDALGAGTGALADGKMWLGSAAGAAAQKTMSGDATITREGVVAIGAGKITQTMLAGESSVKVAKVALTGGLENAFAFNWQNPEITAIFVQRILLDVTHVAGTAGAIMNIGTAASTGTGSDNLIDGVDIQASVGLFDNVESKGANGKSRQRMDANGGATDWVCGQILTAAGSALTGNVYIEYVGA
jgi:hypothetical protein